MHLSEENALIRYDFHLPDHLDSLADLMKESNVQILNNLDEYLHFLQLSTNHIAKRYFIRASRLRMITVYRQS